MSEFDPPVNVRFRHSSHGPSMIGEAESILSRTRAFWQVRYIGLARMLAPAKPVLRILDRIDPLTKLAAMR